MFRSYLSGTDAALEQIFDPCYKNLLTSLQIRANFVVPILVTHQQPQGNATASPEIWGLLIVHQCRSPRQWHSLEIKFLQLITLKNLALIDQLTQVANRRCLDRTLSEEWTRLIPEQRPLSLLLCEIDYFKQAKSNGRNRFFIEVISP